MPPWRGIGLDGASRSRRTCVVTSAHGPGRCSARVRDTRAHRCPDPPPDFVVELLGVDASADAATIDRAYKARIRYVHPDVAGIAGLDETKRLNIAREWLLDPELRTQLPKPAPRWSARRAEPPPPSREATPPPPSARPHDTSWYWDGAAAPPPRPAWATTQPSTTARPTTGRTDPLRAFFESIRSLTRDERARVTYSRGDEPPLFFDDFEHVVSERMWARSEALADAIDRVWRERVDEAPPLLFPRGRVFGNGIVVANAYAQWLLMGDAISQKTRDPVAIKALAARCTASWDASVGHSRYAGHQQEVVAFLDDAQAISGSAVRLRRRGSGHGWLSLPGPVKTGSWFARAPRPELASALQRGSRCLA
jgi:curved DNA-binding protein CbpA